MNSFYSLFSGIRVAGMLAMTMIFMVKHALIYLQTIWASNNSNQMWKLLYGDISVADYMKWSLAIIACFDDVVRLFGIGILPINTTTPTVEYPSSFLKIIHQINWIYFHKLHIWFKSNMLQHLISYYLLLTIDTIVIVNIIRNWSKCRYRSFCRQGCGGCRCCRRCGCRRWLYKMG